MPPAPARTGDGAEAFLNQTFGLRGFCGLVVAACVGSCSGDDAAPPGATGTGGASDGGSSGSAGAGGTQQTGGAAGTGGSPRGGADSSAGGASQPDASTDGSTSLAGDTVGPNGGTLTFAGGGVVFEFPAGAVDHDLKITVTPATAEPTRASSIPGTEYVFGPEGTTFAKPVKVTIHYATLPSHVDPNLLAVAKGVGAQWQPYHSTTDTTAHTVTASIQGFSPYGLVNIGFVVLERGCGLTGIGEVWCWGYGWMSNGADAVEPMKASGNVAFAGYDSLANHRKLASENGVFCAVSTIGETWCAGGDVSTLSSVVGATLPPAKVPGNHRFMEIGIGANSICAIDEDARDGGQGPADGGQGGPILCWGNNDRGQLGVAPTTISRTQTPTYIDGGLNFLHVAVGGNFACGITTDDLTYCWGDEAFGQLGRGQGNFSATPVLVSKQGTPLSLTYITAGTTHACGVDSTGTAVCWGDNNNGQIGDGTAGTGTTTDPNQIKLPTAIPGFSWFRLEAGGDVTCGVTSSARTYCWGQAQRTADGKTHTPADKQATPSEVVAQSFFSLGLAPDASCGLTTSGGAYCWGGNQSGELGIGSEDRLMHTTPEAVKVTGLMP